MRRVLLDVAAEHLTLRIADGRGAAVWSDPEYGDTESLGERLGEAVAAAGWGRIRAASVVLHPPLVQVRTLHDLPRVSERDLRLLITRQQERFFRRVDGEVVVGAKSVERAGDHVVHAAAADLSLLERLEAAASRAGLRVNSIAAASEDAGKPIELRTPTLDRRVRRRGWVRRGALVALAMSGWIAYTAVYVGDLVMDERWVRAELSLLDESMDRLLAVEERITSFSPVADAFVRQADSRAHLTPLLTRVATTLPRDTHLYGIEVARSEGLEIQAHGPDPVYVVRVMGAWWPGAVRLEDVAATDDGSAYTFTVVLERGS
jgi:hypothetical protein